VATFSPSQSRFTTGFCAFLACRIAAIPASTGTTRAPALPCLAPCEPHSTNTSSRTTNSWRSGLVTSPVGADDHGSLSWPATSTPVRLFGGIGAVSRHGEGVVR
jgi:hypothetical protein